MHSSQALATVSVQFIFSKYCFDPSLSYIIFIWFLSMKVDRHTTVSSSTTSVIKRFSVRHISLKRYCTTNPFTDGLILSGT